MGMIPVMRADANTMTDRGLPRLRLATGHDGTPSGETSGAGQRTEIERVLVEARRTLGRLRSDRAMLEQRLAASARVDPIREIRGRSALDEAIDRTVVMIRRLEHLLEGMPVRD